MNEKMSKTIAEQLNVTDFPFTIKDKDGNQIYFEDSKGYWIKNKYDSYGNEIYYEDSNGFWNKYEYDSDGNQICYEDSSGYWKKYEYDSDGNEIYFENSDGKIIDDRPKETITLNGIKYQRMD